MLRSMGALRKTSACAGVLVALASCSVTTSFVGLTGGDAGLEEASAPDGGGVLADGSTADALLEDVATKGVDGCSLGDCFDMPAGFTLVAFGATAKGDGCPSGFGLPKDTVEGPKLAPDACTCECAVTSQPSCPSGVISNNFGTAGAGTCPSSGGGYANFGCATDGFLGAFTTGNEHRFTPPGPTGGSCSTSSTKDMTKLTYTAEGRICQATTVAQCEGKVCAPPVPAAFGACIASAGDVACPSAFPKKHLVGPSASFGCTLDCTCSVSATCKGKMNYYASTDCSGTAGFTAQVNGQCLPTVAGGATFASHRYFPDPPANVACTKSGKSSDLPPVLDEPATVCCRAGG